MLKNHLKMFSSGKQRGGPNGNCGNQLRDTWFECLADGFGKLLVIYSDTVQTATNNKHWQYAIARCDCSDWPHPGRAYQHCTCFTCGMASKSNKIMTVRFCNEFTGIRNIWTHIVLSMNQSFQKFTYQMRWDPEENANRPTRHQSRPQTSVAFITALWE